MADTPPNPLTTNLAQKAYEYIQESILAGNLAEGAVVSEAALAKTLGISRTPVGEAIRQLSREGLLHQVPRFGTIVKQIERQDLFDLYEMREALESHAAARAAEVAPEGLTPRLEQFCGVMRKVVQEVDAAGVNHLDDPMLRRFMSADLAFHMTVLESTGNHRIMEAVRTMRTMSRIFRLRRSRHERALVVEAIGHHDQIVAAITGRDAEAARLAMARHIRVSRDEAARYFDQKWADGVKTTPTYELPPDLQREIDAIEQGG